MIGEPNIIDHNLIGSDIHGSLEIRHATRAPLSTRGVHRAGRDEIILINSVSAHAKTPHKSPVSVKGQAPGEEYDTA